MKKKLLAILFGSALVLGACGGGDDDAANEQDNTNDDTNQEEQADNGDTANGNFDVAAAEEIYSANCAMCHGADLSGGAGPGLTDTGSKYSEDDIVAIINANYEGVNMPKVNVGTEDAHTVAAWLASKK